MPKPIVHTADVLIIGGGFSGMWAAIRAAQQGRSVLVVDKGPRDWRGLGMVSGGDMIVMQPEFNVKDLLDELVYYYDGLCDQEQLAVILEASYDRFRDLENWGHIFARDENGTLLHVPQRGLSFMRYYLYHPYGKGGIHTTDTLQAKMNEYGARRISNVEITELIRKDGRVCGAVGFHARSGVPCVFRAGAVVLCTRAAGSSPISPTPARAKGPCWPSMPGRSCATWNFSSTGTSPYSSPGRDRPACCPMARAF